MNDDLNPERAVIGIVMRNPEAIRDIALHPEDFANVRLGALWKLMTTLADEGEHVSPVTIQANLKRIDEGLRVDAVLLADMLTEAPVTALADRYARLVTDQATRRHVQVAVTRIAQMADSGMDADELVEAARAEIDATRRSTAGMRLVSETIDETLDALERPATAIPTPWEELNHLIKGWRPGALYVIGARPGVGKTLAVVQAAIGLSDHGYVAFSSLEMPEQELHHRLIANVAEVPINRMDDRALTPKDWEKIAAQRAQFGRSRISIDADSLTATQVRSHARTVSRAGRISAVIVDYLQLMEAPHGDRRQRHELVAAYSRSLKLLAKELDCPVIALSQLNRAVEGRHDRRPVLADLRESGAVEQDSDVVILMHEDEHVETDVSMFVAKNRHGARGSVVLSREGWYSRLKPRPWSPHRALETA